MASDSHIEDHIEVEIPPQRIYPLGQHWVALLIWTLALPLATVIDYSRLTYSSSVSISFTLVSSSFNLSCLECDCCRATLAYFPISSSNSFPARNSPVFLASSLADPSLSTTLLLFKSEDGIAADLTTEFPSVPTSNCGLVSCSCWENDKLSFSSF